jgi:hypothetical protein
MDFHRAAFYICLLSSCSKQKSSELRRKQSRSNSSLHSVTLRIACATQLLSIWKYFHITGQAALREMSISSAVEAAYMENL